MDFLVSKSGNTACNGTYTENCWADVVERARWLTLTRVPGSVWPIVSLF